MIGEFEKTEEFYKGHKAESVIAQMLRDEGYYVIVNADLKERGRSGAPGARKKNGFITLPDLDVAKNGYRGFVEVKYKTKADYTTVTNRDEHGIGLNSFKKYREAQRQFGSEVLIFILEGQSGAILYNTIAILLPDVDYHIERKGTLSFVYKEQGEKHSLARIYHGNAMDYGGMIFFPRSSFGLWGKIALLGEEVWTQIGLFDEIKGEGEKLFKVIKHKQPYD